MPLRTAHHPCGGENAKSESQMCSVVFKRTYIPARRVERLCVAEMVIAVHALVDPDQARRNECEGD